MARFANWTNLSETPFVLPPTDPSAVDLLRIFTPDIELPSAGIRPRGVHTTRWERAENPCSCIAGRSARLGRDGRGYIDRIDGQAHVAGHCVTYNIGSVNF